MLPSGAESPVFITTGADHSMLTRPEAHRCTRHPIPPTIPRAPARRRRPPLSEQTPGPTRIVGIGASAGGLETFEQFFSAVPPETDLAFVVVQHLDPTKKGILPELIQRMTPMPVVEAEDGMAIEPGRVYVIPPNRYLTVERGRLRLREIQGGTHIQMSVDVLFRSLAEDQRDRADRGGPLGHGDRRHARDRRRSRSSSGSCWCRSRPPRRSTACRTPRSAPGSPTTWRPPPSSPGSCSATSSARTRSSRRGSRARPRPAPGSSRSSARGPGTTSPCTRRTPSAAASRDGWPSTASSGSPGTSSTSGRTRERSRSSSASS